MLADRLIPAGLIDPSVNHMTAAEVFAALDGLDIPDGSCTAREMKRWRDGWRGEPLTGDSVILRLLKIRLSSFRDTDHPWHVASRSFSERSTRRVGDPFLSALSAARVPVEFRKLASVQERPDVSGWTEMREGVETIVSNIDEAVQHGTGVLIAGAPGVGKTMSVCEILATVIREGYSGYYITAPELVALNRPGMVDEVINGRVREADVLVLDELGAEHVTDWSLSVIDGLLHYRHAKRRPTLITSNASWGTISSALGGRIRDRVEERSRIYELRGPSYRTRR